MNYTTTRRTVLTGALVGAAAVAAPRAQAASTSTFTRIASTPSVSGATGAQGFVAGSTYLYSFKTDTNNDDRRAVIYRVNRSTGARSVMTNASTGAGYIDGIRHANDATIVKIGTQNTFFVVTMVGGSSYELVRLPYTGNEFGSAKGYHLTLDGASFVPSGINRAVVTAERITFFFKQSNRIYVGTLDLTTTVTTIPVTFAFTLDLSRVTVGGIPIADLQPRNQGFFYDEDRGIVYYPLGLNRGTTTSTRYNDNVVLVYRDITPERRTTASPDGTSSFRATRSDLDKFELEGVGVQDATLYFNTNEDPGTDGVYRFTG